MAVTFSGNFSSSSAYMQLKATYNLVSQDITNNRSTVDYHIYLQSTGGWPWANGSFPLELKKDGVVYRTVNISSYQLQANGTQTLATGSFTVDHNADGTKTTWLEAYFVSAHGNAYSAGNYTLTTIPRASDLTLKNVYQATITSATYGQTVRLSIARASASFTTTIRWAWNGYTGTVVDKINYTEHDWVVPLAWMGYIPNSTSTWGTLYIDTYSGTTLIGTKSVTLTTVVPDTIVPTLSSVTVAEATTSPNVSAVTGGTSYLQGASTLKFTYNGVATVYGATVASYKVSVGGRTYDGNNAITDVFNMPGAYSAVATVTDSRGRTASKTVNITIAPYEKPNLATFTAYRTSNGTSATVQAKATGSYSPITNNVIKYKLGYRVKGGTTFTYITEETLSNAVDYFTDKVTTIGTAFTQSLSYDIEVTLYDKLYPATTTISVGTAEVPLAFSKNGIGIGKIPTQGVLDVKGATYIEGALTLTGATGGNVPRVANTNGYNGLIHPDGNTANWLRVPSSGLLPYASGGASSSLGTASWQWQEIHGKNVYVNGQDLGATGAIMVSPAVGIWHYNDWGGGNFTYMKYWKTSNKVVHLTGLAYMEGGYRGSYTTLFTLPVGYRPQGTVLFNVLSATGPMRLEVKEDGVVQMVGNNAPDWISLAGVFFYQYA